MLRGNSLRRLISRWKQARINNVEKQQYLQHTNIDHHEDPLAWWKHNPFHLPLLQELAKKYLCIPSTSVPAEMLFSKAGELVSARRSNVKPKNVNMLLLTLLTKHYVYIFKA